MTLIELVMAIVIIGVGLAGVMIAFSAAVSRSADPMIRKQMLSIADEMMEEIALKPFEPVANAAPVACARDTYNDIFDYNGYTATGICDIAGAAIASLASYSVSVAVVGDAALPSIANSANAAKITVTVSQSGTTESIQLVSWRTWYACDLPAICPL